MSDESAPDLDDEIITCWCGETGTYDELFDDDGLDRSCGGTGYVDCCRRLPLGNRAALTIEFAIADALDAGAKIDDVEATVRKTPFPFGNPKTAAVEIRFLWTGALHARFRADGRGFRLRRRK